jgi:hypothetical protein
MERADRRAVLPARVATFTGLKKIEGIPGELEKGRAGVVVKPSKNNKERE